MKIYINNKEINGCFYAKSYHQFNTIPAWFELKIGATDFNNNSFKAKDTYKLVNIAGVTIQEGYIVEMQVISDAEDGFFIYAKGVDKTYPIVVSNVGRINLIEKGTLDTFIKKICTQVGVDVIFKGLPSLNDYKSPQEETIAEYLFALADDYGFVVSSTGSKLNVGFELPIPTTITINDTTDLLRSVIRLDYSKSSSEHAITTYSWEKETFQTLSGNNAFKNLDYKNSKTSLPSLNVKNSLNWLYNKDVRAERVASFTFIGQKNIIVGNSINVIYPKLDITGQFLVHKVCHVLNWDDYSEDKMEGSYTEIECIPLGTYTSVPMKNLIGKMGNKFIK